MKDAMAILGVKAPEDYLDFLLESNGAEGFMPNGHYLMIDSVEQLVPCNEPYGLREAGPGLVAFGSDGAAVLYAFDTRHSPVTIVEVDSSCMDVGPVTLLGHTFSEFLETLNADPTSQP
jgi:hypothetical protein